MKALKGYRYDVMVDGLKVTDFAALIEYSDYQKKKVAEIYRKKLELSHAPKIVRAR